MIVQTDRPFRLLLVYEPEADCAHRLTAAGFPADIAREVAVYLAQATDLPPLLPEIGHVLSDYAISLVPLRLDDLPGRLPSLKDDGLPTMSGP